MRVDQAFAKAGFQIVEAQKIGKEQLVFSIRVPMQDAKIPARWKTMLDFVLVTAEGVMSKATPKWEIDVSKRFYAKNGAVRYLWRITLSGNLKLAQSALTTAVINSLRTGHELDVVPLVGQNNMTPDPRNGKFKGAYPRHGDADMASQAVASAFIT